MVVQVIDTKPYAFVSLEPQCIHGVIASYITVHSTIHTYIDWVGGGSGCGKLKVGEGVEGWGGGCGKLGVLWFGFGRVGMGEVGGGRGCVELSALWF